jgi:Domain of unknown function (DUF6966)
VGTAGCHHGPVPTLADLVATLDSIPRRSDTPPTIYARRPWTADSEATVLYGERSVESVTAPGFTYVLEVYLAKEVIEVWSLWRDGKTPTLTDAIGAVIWYAEYDAYEPVDEADKLVVHLCDLTRLLEAHGEEQWALWLAERRDRIAHGEGHALRQLRDSFGGMGSVNDLLINPINGHHVNPADVADVNQRLCDLRATVWTSLQTVLRQLDRP